MIYNAYEEMSREFDFCVIDAQQAVDQQQKTVRQIVADKIDLPAYKWRMRR
jgi:thymidylate kinase